MTRAFDVRAVHRCLEMLHKTATPSPPAKPSLLNASYICTRAAGDKLRIPLTRPERPVLGGADINPAAIK